jgi:hypothetical protein
MRMKEDHMRKGQIQAVVKYGSYHKEKTKVWKANVGKIENWTTHAAEDHWTCFAGNMLHFHRESKETLESGYEIRRRHFCFAAWRK